MQISIACRTDADRRTAPAPRARTRKPELESFNESNSNANSQKDRPRHDTDRYRPIHRALAGEVAAAIEPYFEKDTMRSMSTFRRIQTVLARRRHSSQTPAVIFNHARHVSGRTPGDYALLGDSGRRRHQHDRHRSSPRRCVFSASSSILSSSSSPDPHSFHGIALPEDDEDEAKTTQQPRLRRPPQPEIEEAEIVRSEEDRVKTRELMKEVTRAEMSAHSVPANVGKKKNDDDDASLSAGKEAGVASGPYEKLSKMLAEAERRHERIDPRVTPSAHARSCMDMGDLHYRLGGMDSAQSLYEEAFRDLSTNAAQREDDEDGTRMMIAQSMHALGTVHARCGEHEEASRWYEGSLDRKLEFSEDVVIHRVEDEACETVSHRYELGKTFNGMAALEIMKGGDVRWEKAMGLFEEAERNFLHDYERERTKRLAERDQSDTEDLDVATKDNASSTCTSKAAIREMTPRHVEALVNVRANMGELLRQRGKFEDAMERIRLALDMARAALENSNENAVAGGEIDEDGPSRYEQGNTIVELLTKSADTLASAEKFDEAAEAYEEALSSHVHFRRLLNEVDDGGKLQSTDSLLPATVAASTNIKFDLEAATTIEAAIRGNLGNALAQIGQDKLALGHYEASLAIKRRFGGDFHMEVAHTLDAMGALMGGPLKDFTKGLICFKEALFIYRTNLDEIIKADENDSGDNGEDRNAFFGGEDAEEIDRHIQNALKNIGLIEAALLKNRDGASNSRRK